METQESAIRLSVQASRVLDACLESPAGLSEADIQQRTGLTSWTLYPLLLRLEDAGWLVSRWEPVDWARAGSPRRRLYRMSTRWLARSVRGLEVPA